MEVIKQAHHKITNITEDRATLVDLFVNIEQRGEIIKDLESTVFRNKLVISNTNLQNIRAKLIDQTAKIKTLQDRNAYLERNFSINDMQSKQINQTEIALSSMKRRSEQLERNCQKLLEKKDAEITKLKQSYETGLDTISACKKRILELTDKNTSLQSKLKNRNVKIDQLAFRNRLLDDSLKEMRYRHLPNGINNSPSHVQGITRLNMHSTCSKDEIQQKLDKTKHEEDSECLEETNIHLCNLNKDYQRELDRALQKEYELQNKVYELQSKLEQLEKEFEEKKQTEAHLTEIIAKLVRRIKNLKYESTETDKCIQELWQCKRKLLIEKEESKITQMQLYEDNERLKISLKEKETKLTNIHDNSQNAESLKEETERRMNEQVVEQKRRILHLQNELKVVKEYLLDMKEQDKKANEKIQQLQNQSCDKETNLRANVIALENINKEKDAQLSELRHEMNRNTLTRNERENEMMEQYHSLQRRLKDTETELEKCRQKIGHINFHLQSTQIQMPKMGEEDVYVNHKVKETQTALQGRRSHSKMTEKADTIHDKTICRQTRDVKNPEGEFDKSHAEIDKMYEITKENETLHQTLNQSHENEVALCESVDKYMREIHDKNEEIAILKHRLEKMTPEYEDQGRVASKIQKHELESKEEEQLSDINRMQAYTLSNEIRQKEATLREQHIQLESTSKMVKAAKENLHETIKDQNRQIQHLQKEKDSIEYKLKEKESLEKRNEYLQETFDKSSERESALRQTIKELQIKGHTLETQAKNSDAKLKQCKQEAELEKEQFKTIEFKMSKQIENLNCGLREKETCLQNLRIQTKRSVDLQEKAKVVQLNEIICKKDSIIKDLETKITEIGAKQQEKHQEVSNLAKEKEAELGKTIDDLKWKNQESTKQMSDLQHKLNTLSTLLLQRETELNDTRLSLQMKLKNAETELEQRKEEIKYEKEQSKRNFEQFKEEIKGFKLEIKGMEKTIQSLQETEERLKGVVSNQTKQISQMKEELKKGETTITKIDQLNKDYEHAKQALDKSLAKEAALLKSTNDIQNKNREEEDQISELKLRLLELKEKSRQEDQELRNRNRFLQVEMVKMGEEMEKCKLEMKEKEKALQETNEKLKDNVYRWEEEKSKLNDTVTNMKNKIQHLQERNIKMNNVDQVKKHNEQIHQSFNNLKETEITLRKNNQALQSRMEKKEREATKLQEQLKDMSKTSNQKEKELTNNIRSMEEQLKTTEANLKQHQLKTSLESTNHKRLNEEIESLKLKLKDKETTLQGYYEQYNIAVKYKEEVDSHLQEITSKHNEEIQHLEVEIERRDVELANNDHLEKRIKQLQQACNESQENEKEQLKTNEILRHTNKEKENQIIELNEKVNAMSNLSKQKENELQNMIRSLQTKLKTTQLEIKQLHVDLLHEHAQVNSHQQQTLKKDEEIKRLELEIKHKETTLQTYDMQYKDAVKLKQELECRLNDIINKQRREIENLHLEMEKKDIESTNYDQVKKHSEQVQETLKLMNERGSALRKTNQDLQIKTQEQANEVTELRQKLNKMTNTSSQKENELRNLTISLKKQLENTETELKQLQLEILKKEALVATNQKQMDKMGDEIECLKSELKQKETAIQDVHVQYQEATKLNQKEELKLNETIKNQKAEILHIKGEMKRVNIELAQYDQMNKHFKEAQNALKESQEKEASLHETIKELKSENQENEKRISDLSLKLHKTTEKSNQIESKFKVTNHSLHHKIKSMETEIEEYKREITNEKHISNAAQVKISEMGTQINDLINTLKRKEEEQHKKEIHLDSIIHSQEKQIQNLERNIKKHEKKMEYLEAEHNTTLLGLESKMAELKNQMKHTLTQLHDTEAELDDTKSRLSRVMGDKLTDNNPNITDLSDRNRPTKIAEKCAELYDNEWTDAFDILEKLFRTEESAIEALLLILQNAMHFCKTMARRQIEIIEREMCFADEKEKIKVSSDIQKLIKDRRKATATAVVGNLKKIYVAQLKQSKDKTMRAALDVEPYTSECIEICWFMLIQDPPVVFAPLPIKGLSFDTNFYKPYTKSGTHVDFAVWPALLLHERGPILAKGVAQGHGNK